MNFLVFLLFKMRRKDPPKKGAPKSGKSFIKPTYESMKANVESKFLRPAYVQDDTNISPVKPDLRGDGFYDYLNQDLNVSNDQIQKLEGFIPKIADMETTGEHIHRSGSLGQRASKYSEDGLRLLLGGTENADKAIGVVNKIKGEETSKGDFNINDSAIGFLPDKYKNVPEQNKALAVVARNFSEAIKRGLSEDQAYKIAASAYNKGLENAIQDERQGNLSYYGKKVSGQ